MVEEKSPNLKNSTKESFLKPTNQLRYNIISRRPQKLYIVLKLDLPVSSGKKYFKRCI